MIGTVTDHAAAQQEAMAFFFDEADHIVDHGFPIETDRDFPQRFVRMLNIAWGPRRMA